MGSADDWPPHITRVPPKPKVAQFCAALWPNFTPALTIIEHVLAGFFAGFVFPASDAFAFEQVEEAFRHRVILADGASASDRRTISLSEARRSKTTDTTPASRTQVSTHPRPFAVIQLS